MRCLSDGVLFRTGHPCRPHREGWQRAQALEPAADPRIKALKESLDEKQKVRDFCMEYLRAHQRAELRARRCDAFSKGMDLVFAGSVVLPGVDGQDYRLNFDLQIFAELLPSRPA